MGIVLAQTRLPLTEAWTSRFLAGGAIGAVMAPWLVGELLKKHPAALGWSEVVFILLQVVAYVSVALMPRLRSPADAVSEEERDAEAAYAAGTSASSSLATGAAEAKPAEPATAARESAVGGRRGKFGGDEGSIVSAAPPLLAKQHGFERALPPLLDIAATTTTRGGGGAAAAAAAADGDTTSSGGVDQEPRYLEVASSNLHTTTTAGAGDGIGNGGGGSGDGGSCGDGSGGGGSDGGGSDGGSTSSTKVEIDLAATCPSSDGGATSSGGVDPEPGTH
eukprot:gene22832-33082_t